MRMMQFSHKYSLHVPSALTAAAGVVYNMSGMVDVALYIITRPGIFAFLRGMLSRTPASATSATLVDDARSSLALELGSLRRSGEIRRGASNGGGLALRDAGDADGGDEGSSGTRVPDRAASICGSERVPSEYSPDFD